MNNNYRELLRHSVWQTLLLSFYIVAAWITDNYLLSHFPLDGMSLISFRVIEVALHLGSLRLVYRLIFPRKPPNDRWWV